MSTTRTASKETRGRSKGSNGARPKLPDNVKMVTVSLPIYTGEVNRTTLLRAYYHVKTKGQSDVLHRLYLAMHAINKENVPSYNKMFQELLDAIDRSIR